MSEPLTRAERDAILERARALERTLYPPEGEDAPAGPERVKIMDAWYQVLAEYGDRLPRVAMSRCPLSGQLLKRSFDPFGLDGPWWHKSRIVKIEEPPAPLTFQVLLGALDLRGRTPAESRDPVIPGPGVPFVVPRLLKLPGMVAVVSRLALATGDLAYPVAYFSRDEIAPQYLHQHWLRQDLWFPNDAGGTSWMSSNDVWDFDLAKHLEAGTLRWIAPDDPDATLMPAEAARDCPYVDLPGDRFPQAVGGGERELLEPPDGRPIDPYQE